MSRFRWTKWLSMPICSKKFRKKKLILPGVRSKIDETKDENHSDRKISEKIDRQCVKSTIDGHPGGTVVQNSRRDFLNSTTGENSRNRRSLRESLWINWNYERKDDQQIFLSTSAEQIASFETWKSHREFYIERLEHFINKLSNHLSSINFVNYFFQIAVCLVIAVAIPNINGLSAIATLAALFYSDFNYREHLSRNILHSLDEIILLEAEQAKLYKRDWIVVLWQNLGYVNVCSIGISKGLESRIWNSLERKVIDKNILSSLRMRRTTMIDELERYKRAWNRATNSGNNLNPKNNV